mmetsp:Transcript_37177/g.57063  ORF Transcript_37177/g.57063 Transcript_37177/m.57063 type:complete len:268 (+) Transcript_37177:46-849(+)
MKNIAVALLLSLISTDEAQAANTGIETLVESTLATELDLKEFAVDHGKEDDEESEDEEEGSDEEGEEEEEDNEPEPKEKVHTKTAPSKNSTVASNLNHGRDAHGMFKNHPNYVHLRNKMNSQEQKHQQMFDVINEKLVDQDFFKKATHGHEPQNKTAIAHHHHMSAVQKNSTESPLGMNDEDAKCYAERYKDLNGTDPHDHYLTLGIDQGRLPTCAKNLSDIEAQAYLDRYPDLQEHLGRSGPGALFKAREHFVNHGYKEKRNVEPV